MKSYYNFCIDRNADPFIPQVDIVVNYLSNLYESKFGYSYINTARSALSSVLPKMNGCKIGEHDLVVRVLKGVGKLRPPSCRYELIWDVNLVINTIRVWGENLKLSLEKLTLKLVGLLALLSAQRCQTLQSIKISEIVINSFVQIKISKQLKTFNPKKSQQVIKLHPYLKDPLLCPVKCLESYLAVTAAYRKDEDNLFFVY